MDILLSFRDGVSRFYGKHDTAIRMFGKFIAALAVFSAIHLMLGQMAIIRNPLITIACAAVCSFLPSNSMLLMGTVMILLHFYGISIEAAAAGGGMLIIGLLIYFSVAPQSAMPLILGAVGTGLGLPGTVAVFLGLTEGPLAAIGAGFGVIFFKLIRTIGLYGGVVEAESADAADAMVEKMVALINRVLSDREMFLTAVLVIVLIWLVGALKKLNLPYMWIIASVIGMGIYAAEYFLVRVQLGLSAAPILYIWDAMSAIILAFVAQMLLFQLDFKKTRDIRFSDDDYYYYVKAVPKKKVVKRVSDPDGLRRENRYVYKRAEDFQERRPDLETVNRTVNKTDYRNDTTDDKTDDTVNDRRNGRRSRRGTSSESEKRFRFERR